MSMQDRTSQACPVCGATVHPKDRFCAACGADVVAGGEGSLFDELMTGEGRGSHPTPVAGYPVPEHADTAFPGATGAPAAGGGRAAGGAADPVGPAPEADATGADHPRTAAYHPAPPAAPTSPPDLPPPAREDGPGRGALLLPILVLVGIVIAAVLAWQLAPRGTETAGTTSSQSGSDSSAGESPAGGSGDGGAAPEQVQLPATAERCDEVGDAVAYRGNEVTSCEFAVAVASSLANAGPDLPATVTARSPVTEQDYEMTCENTAPVTCRGGNDALVYVERP